ncbi:MAG: hypothetical protein LBD22_06970 [Spirochaetaceae bacterium]|nr:hypothetical protein [Spirochaetaceae bacterium]
MTILQKRLYHLSIAKSSHTRQDSPAELLAPLPHGLSWVSEQWAVGSEQWTAASGRDTLPSAELAVS